MYVRIKRRRITCPGMGHAGSDSLAAVLVTSARVDGAPRQRVVAHLAYLSGPYAHVPSRRRDFWMQVQERLAPYAAELDTKARERIARTLAAAVPQPTPAELEAQDAALRTAFARLGKP